MNREKSKNHRWQWSSELYPYLYPYSYLNYIQPNLSRPTINDLDPTVFDRKAGITPVVTAVQTLNLMEIGGLERDKTYHAICPLSLI